MLTPLIQEINQKTQKPTDPKSVQIANLVRDAGRLQLALSHLKYAKNHSLTQAQLFFISDTLQQLIDQLPKI